MVAAFTLWRKREVWKEADKDRPLFSSRAFYIFLLYTIYIWCCELLDLICYLSGIVQATWISRLTAACLTIAAARYLIGKIRFFRLGADPLFCLGMVLFAVFFAWKSIIPDMSYDTMNYHLLSQIPGFVDNLNYHVLPGRFQMYGFRLGDRMFYPFRLLLGLRMGTLLNALSMVLIFRQIAVILTWIRDQFSEGDRVKSWQISLLAFLASSRFELLMESGSYMVELLALPFFLEMVFILIRETAEAERTAAREALLFCLFGGLLFCLKMTNIVFIAPLVLLYIWKIRRFITLPVFISCLAAGAVPVMVYLIYNGISTGNPVYPYYNTVFKSPYFRDFDFKDLRWGPQNLKEILLWPYYMIRFPEYRMSEIYSLYNLDLAAGYVALAALLTASVMAAGRKKDCRAIWFLLLLYTVSFLFWAATTGHIRYFMGGLLLSGIFPAFCYLWAAGTGKGLWKMAGFLLVIPLAGRAFCGFRDVANGKEWAIRINTRESYTLNWGGVLRDREIFPETLRKNADMLLLTYGDYGSYARLIGEDVPVVSRRSVDDELYAFRDQYLDWIDTMMQDGKIIYDMFPQGMDILSEYLELQNENGYYIEEMFYLKNAIWGSQAFTMTKLGPAGERLNTWHPFGTKWAIHYAKDGNPPVLKAIVGNTDWYLAPMSLPVQIFASDGSTRKLAAAFTLEEEYEALNLPLDLSGLEGEVSLEFVLPEELAFLKGVVINPSVMSAGALGG